jgi:hypothetical protein
LYLKETYKSIDFEHIDTGNLDERDRNLNDITSSYIMTFKNPENKKYIVVSFWDYGINLFNKNFWDVDNCVQIITSLGFNRKEFESNKARKNQLLFYPSLDKIYTPFTYCPYTLQIQGQIDTIYSNKIHNTKKDEVAFRGFLYSERKYLSKNLINSKIKILSRIDDMLYFEEQVQNICSLSLNGVAEICNRDIELFGLGVPVMRLDLNVEFHNKLIPDYHYISLGKCDFEYGSTHIDYDELKSRIVEKFDYILNNKDLVFNIGKNARKWYTENCNINSMVNILDGIIKLERLFE